MLFIERTLVCVLPGECFVPNPFVKCSWVFVCELKCNRYHVLCLCVVKGVVLTAQLLPNIVSVKPNINAAQTRVSLESASTEEIAESASTEEIAESASTEEIAKFCFSFQTPGLFLSQLTLFPSTQTSQNRNSDRNLVNGLPNLDRGIFDDTEPSLAGPCYVSPLIQIMLSASQ